EIELWADRLSRFRRDSLVAHLQRHAVERPVQVEPEVFALFETSEAIRERSGGAFDLAWYTGGRLRLDPARQTVELSSPDLRLDLGAIGKGFAIDRAVELLRAHQIERALLHGGTSTVFALGAPPGCDGWRVAFAGVEGLEGVELCDAACSVSAQHGRTLEDGHGHVRDPRSGAAPERRLPAVVRAPNATLADAWSTALLVDPSRADAAAAQGVALLTPARA
ncbi:MAG: FAD:protein FMN transferase, partial [Planctomycetota bacterium]